MERRNEDLRRLKILTKAFNSDGLNDFELTILESDASSKHF